MFGGVMAWIGLAPQYLGREAVHLLYKFKLLKNFSVFLMQLWGAM